MGGSSRLGGVVVAGWRGGGGSVGRDVSGRLEGWGWQCREGVRWQCRERWGWQ